MKRAACVLIQREDGKILGITRKDGSSIGLIGGKCDEGESCSDAAERELRRRGTSSEWQPEYGRRMQVQER